MTKENKYESLKKSFAEKNITYYTINIEDIEFYISDIERITLKKIGKLLEDKPMRAYEIILKDVFLGGDRDVFEDSTIFLSAMEPVLNLIEPYDLSIDEKDKQFHVEIKNDRLIKNRKHCVLKSLEIGDLTKIVDMYNRGDIFGATEYMLDVCWISGDEDIKTNNKLFMSVIKVVEKLIQVKHYSIKKN